MRSGQLLELTQILLPLLTLLWHRYITLNILIVFVLDALYFTLQVVLKSTRLEREFAVSAEFWHSVRTLSVSSEFGRRAHPLIFTNWLITDPGLFGLLPLLLHFVETCQLLRVLLCIILLLLSSKPWFWAYVIAEAPRWSAANLRWPAEHILLLEVVWLCILLSWGSNVIVHLKISLTLVFRHV